MKKTPAAVYICDYCEKAFKLSDTILQLDFNRIEEFNHEGTYFLRRGDHLLKRTHGPYEYHKDCIVPAIENWFKPMEIEVDTSR